MEHAFKTPKELQYQATVKQLKRDLSYDAGLFADYIDIEGILSALIEKYYYERSKNGESPSYDNAIVSAYEEASGFIKRIKDGPYTVIRGSIIQGRVIQEQKTDDFEMNNKIVDHLESLGVEQEELDMKSFNALKAELCRKSHENGNEQIQRIQAQEFKLNDTPVLKFENASLVINDEIIEPLTASEITREDIDNYFSHEWIVNSMTIKREDLHPDLIEQINEKSPYEVKVASDGTVEGFGLVVDVALAPLADKELENAIKALRRRQQAEAEMNSFIDKMENAQVTFPKDIKEQLIKMKRKELSL